MALHDITVTTGATVDGRALARVGAVTLDHNTISRSVCATTPAAKVAAQVAAVPQVVAVPKGAVRTGDGSTSGGSDGRALLAGALVLAGAGGASVVAARRRCRLNL